MCCSHAAAGVLCLPSPVKPSQSAPETDSPAELGADEIAREIELLRLGRTDLGPQHLAAQCIGRNFRGVQHPQTVLRVAAAALDTDLQPAHRTAIVPKGEIGIALEAHHACRQHLQHVHERVGTVPAEAPAVGLMAHRDLVEIGLDACEFDLGIDAIHGIRLAAHAIARMETELRLVEHLGRGQFLGWRRGPFGNTAKHVILPDALARYLLQETQFCEVADPRYAQRTFRQISNENKCRPLCVQKLPAFPRWTILRCQRDKLFLHISVYVFILTQG